ncbi:thioesterase family protein [Gordonia sputi]|uniref:thioesterase family protein n=1 Tax=Gordonia sputi TaxID=36823 RepID=UPI002271322B|nr:thioesterase family protein [Gordonia sputi]
MDSFYKPAGQGTFESLPATAGPWGPQMQHAGPPSALLVRVIEEDHVATDQRLGRVSIDVLRAIPVAPISIETVVLRPGSRISLIEATGFVDGHAVICARAWRFPRVPSEYPATDTLSEESVAATIADIEAWVTPEEGYDGGVIPGASLDGYLTATEFRFTRGYFSDFGPAAAWGRTHCTLVPEEELSPWQTTLILADSSSGISLAAHPHRYPAINADLTLVLHRDPAGPWIHIDSTTHTVPGQGSAAYAVLSDKSGRIGTCTQSLFASITGKQG